MRLLLLVLLSSAAALAQTPAQPPAQAPAAPAAPAQEASGWMAQFDQLFPQRADPKVLKQLYALVEPQLKQNDQDFEANWRLAALLNWDANNYPNGDLKAGLGKKAWLVADRAIGAKPDDVRGQYNAAVGIGLYSEGVGILTALSQGLEGKFKSRAEAAQRIDKDYLDGAPQVVWGRYFFKLPWPKRDIGQSIKVLSAAVQSHPDNLRAKLYLADSLLEDGKKAEAKKLADQIVAAPTGKDPSEDNKVKADTAQWIKQHQGDF
jgi:hypothetical protein